MSTGESNTFHDGSGATTAGSVYFPSAIDLKSFEVCGRYSSTHPSNGCSSISMVAKDAGGSQLWSWSGSLTSNSWSNWRTMNVNMAGVKEVDIVSRPSGCYPSFRNFYQASHLLPFTPCSVLTLRAVAMHMRRECSFSWKAHARDGSRRMSIE